MKTSVNIKLAFFAVTAMLTFVSLSNAQRMQRMRMSPEDRAKMLADSLSLDSTQTASVIAIFKDQQEQMAKIREQHQGDFEGMREAMTEVRTKTDDKILAILTEPQKAKYQEMMKNRPTGRMGGPRGGGN